MVSSKIFSITTPPARAVTPPKIAAYHGIFSEIFNLIDKSRSNASSSSTLFLLISPLQLILASSVSKIIGELINALFLPIINLPEALFIFIILFETSSRPSTIPLRLKIRNALKKVVSGISVSRFKSFMRKSNFPSRFVSLFKLFH